MTTSPLHTRSIELCAITFLRSFKPAHAYYDVNKSANYHLLSCFLSSFLFYLLVSFFLNLNEIHKRGDHESAKMWRLQFQLQSCWLSSVATCQLDGLRRTSLLSLSYQPPPYPLSCTFCLTEILYTCCSMIESAPWLTSHALPSQNVRTSAPYNTVNSQLTRFGLYLQATDFFSPTSSSFIALSVPLHCSRAAVRVKHFALMSLAAERWPLSAFLSLSLFFSVIFCNRPTFFTFIACPPTFAQPLTLLTTTWQQLNMNWPRFEDKMFWFVWIVFADLFS